MATSEAALEQMSKPTATVVKILEENWPRIREKCNYFSEGEVCPLTNKECRFPNCPLLEEGAEKEKVGGVKNGKSSL
ncbi:hypothetical protein AKJ65_00615 [candidate division MSBL1 archaeon SCGC-AAA259E19]|uniref:Uncharacterized protein n=1 Tax=candidate division MSBL1 archaeon SCGC-AAA259E19 TaxID=1698264 RepID=A0A133UNQ7_9EURY|nr:hypothetical protein AKJ65_00615 [candidate division MSBL1 archaeon SCGC-AAA259E19]